MAGALISTPGHIMALTPGASMVGPNSRVQGSAGLLGTTSDSVTFSDGGTGVWIPVPTRIQIAGAPAVTATTTGTSSHPSPNGTVPGVMTVVVGDPRVSGGP